MASESTASSLYFFLLSLFFSFWQPLQRSLGHFQPFCFHPAKPRLCKRRIPPLSIFGTPMDQWQGTGVRGGVAWTINSSDPGNIRCWPIPTGFGGAVPGLSLALAFFKLLFFHWLFAGVYRKPDFPSASSWIFLPSVMNTLCFHAWLSLCKAWVNDKWIFLGIVGHVRRFVMPEASQQQDTFMELEKNQRQKN